MCPNRTEEQNLGSPILWCLKTLERFLEYLLPYLHCEQVPGDSEMSVSSFQKWFLQLLYEQEVKWPPQVHLPQADVLSYCLS